MYIQDEQFGKIVDYDWLRSRMHEIYDNALPDFNLHQSAIAASKLAQNEPSIAISAGASALAYSILIAAEEFELAEQLKGNIFTLGWTEEHTGSDLLSIKTQATPLSDDPENKEYHIQGSKWMINCSYHADYHVVLAKLDPTQDGPRSLSFFLVPRSSCKNFERLGTHVLDKMVLTKYDIDGPGRLLGKVGHGLTIVQRMAMPSKYQCTYMGVCWMNDAIPAALEWLGQREIFSTNPIQFSNVFRQMYDVVIKAATYDFIMHRSMVFNRNGFLQFHGTMLKSFLLLRINELLSKTLLVMGSKGFTSESIVGRNAFDSFILPVFDGHYTINTLMTAKHAPRYLSAEGSANMEERIAQLREEAYIPRPSSNEIYVNSRDIRKPPFYDYAAYLKQFNIPLDIDLDLIVNSMRDLVDEVTERELSNEPEYKYKIGDLLHWMESIIAAAELWKTTEEDHYLNAIAIQYNGFANQFNEVVSEGSLATEFLPPVRQVPFDMDEIDDRVAFLKRLLDVQAKIQKVPTP